jgi:hypothetical protein
MSSTTLPLPPQLPTAARFGSSGQHLQTPGVFGCQWAVDEGYLGNKFKNHPTACLHCRAVGASRTQQGLQAQGQDTRGQGVARLFVRAGLSCRLVAAGLHPPCALVKHTAGMYTSCVDVCSQANTLVCKCIRGKAAQVTGRVSGPGRWRP